jgi:hypothetical protein
MAGEVADRSTGDELGVTPRSLLAFSVTAANAPFTANECFLIISSMDRRADLGTARLVGGR